MTSAAGSDTNSTDSSDPGSDPGSDSGAGPAPVGVDIDAFALPDQPDQPDQAPAPPGRARGGRAGAATRSARGAARRGASRPRRPVAQDGAGDQEADEPLPLQYETSVAWFKGWFHPVIERQPTQAVVWCPKWWAHREVCAILDALWIAWEGATSSVEPDAMLVWWDRAITMLGHLTDPSRGPMARCSRDAHQVARGDLRLPYMPEPDGFFGLFHETGPDDYGTLPWTTVHGPGDDPE